MITNHGARQNHTTSDMNHLRSTGGVVRVIRHLDEVEELRSAWSTLRGHRDADIDAYRTNLSCSADPATPYILVIERDGHPDAMLVGTSTTTTVKTKLAYFAIRQSRVRVITFVYGGFLGNHTAENSELITHELIRSLRRGDADIALLGYIRKDCPLYHFAIHAPPLLMRDHFPSTQAHWIMDLPQSIEAMYAGLSSEHRWKLRRDAKKFRAAYSNNLRVSRFDGYDQLSELICDSERVAATTYQRGLGVGFSTSRQIRELLTLEATKGWLRGYILYVHDRPCAFWIGCVYNSVFLSEYLGHDPEYGKYSPGIYLLVHVMEELCREGLTGIDFGIGEAAYKQRFGTHKWDESLIYLYAPTFKGMKVKVLRATAMLITRTTKTILGRTTLLDRLKKFWRQHLVRAKGPVTL
jgi:hypothetical protein